MSAGLVVAPADGGAAAFRPPYPPPPQCGWGRLRW